MAAIWGFVGVVVFLASAIYRLSTISLELELISFTVLNWLVLAVWVFIMSYLEGYKGFQKSFSPRVAARIYYLYCNATVLRCVLAPFFCLGFFDAYRRRMIFIWAFTIGIYLLIQLMGFVPMPWRGIVDVGVVIGLSWGLLSLLVHTRLVFKEKGLVYSADVPIKNDKSGIKDRGIG